MCYYGSWAVYRPGDGKFDVDDIDPMLCTHLIFGFAALSIETWEIEAFDPWNDLDPEEGGGKGEKFSLYIQIWLKFCVQKVNLSSIFIK